MTLRSIGVIAVIVGFVLSGCATFDSSGGATPRFLDTLNLYPPTQEPLKIPKLSPSSLERFSQDSVSEVFIMVHPGYSLFFRDRKRSRYGNAKYALVSSQFERETGFMSEAAEAGKILILILPGNYETESTAPLSYTAYLNTTVSRGQKTFYLFSESVSTGSLDMDEMVDLYYFLQRVKARKVLIGGGYIGRCQREFYNELTAYFDKKTTFIVPEISMISPDDVSEEEADVIFESIKLQDYTPVKKFIDQKVSSGVNILSIPQTRPAEQLR